MPRKQEVPVEQVVGFFATAENTPATYQQALYRYRDASSYWAKALHTHPPISAANLVTVLKGMAHTILRIRRDWEQEKNRHDLTSPYNSIKNILSDSSLGLSAWTARAEPFLDTYTPANRVTISGALSVIRSFGLTPEMIVTCTPFVTHLRTTLQQQEIPDSQGKLKAAVMKAIQKLEDWGGDQQGERSPALPRIRPSTRSRKLSGQ